MSGAFAVVRDSVAAAIAAAGLGTYRPHGGYIASDSVPVFFSRMPAVPDRLIVVTAYPVSIPHTVGVQIRVRGSADATTSAEDLVDDIREALHGRADLPGIELLTWRSGARIGFDARNRDEMSANFYALVSDPATALYHD